MKLFIVNTITLTLMLLVVSLAQAESLVRAKLSGFEWQAEQAMWHPSEIPELLNTVRDSSTPLFLRKRALAVLGVVRDPEAEQALMELSVQVGSKSLQRRAVDVLCETAGTSVQKPEILTLLISVLESEDEYLRHRAAVCLMNYVSDGVEASRVGIALETYHLVASDWELRSLSEQ